MQLDLFTGADPLPSPALTPTRCPEDRATASVCALETASAGPGIEPSFADTILAIGAADDLPRAKKTHWTCSLRRIGKALDEPLELIPARYTAVRHRIDALHHLPLRMDVKTLRNHRSNVRAALLWLRKEAGLPSRGAPLSDDWLRLQQGIGTDLHRKRLAAFLRYCSAKKTAPADVNEEVVDRFFEHRKATTRLAAGIADRRALARDWNACAGSVSGWPAQRLEEPPLKQTGLTLADLPEGLRADIDGYLAGLRKARRSANGKRLQPAKESTIRTRRAEIMAFVGKAVACGYALDDLTSFSDLLCPDLVGTILDRYWQEKGEAPSTYVIDLAWKLLAIARETSCLSPEDLEHLDDMRHELEQHRETGLTPKNRAVIRQVLVDDVWRSVLRCPHELMAEAMRLHNHAPIRAGVRAGIATATRILCVAPIRIGNLSAIRIGTNLIRPGGPAEPWWIVFPNYDVKNRVNLEFELDGETTALIDQYLQTFRAALIRGHMSDWLFPGEAGGHKGTTTLSEQVTEQVKKATGVRLTAHQFRHAAAAIFLRHRPGEYELVRRLLGHRSIVTTMRFYAGLESLEATRIFGDLITEEINRRPAAAARTGRNAGSARPSAGASEARP